MKRAACLVGLLLWVTCALSAAGGRFTGTVAHPTDTGRVSPALTCAHAAAGHGGPAAAVTYPLGELSGTTASDVSGSAAHGTYSSTGVLYAQPGPCLRDSGTAVTLDGSTGYVAGPTTTYDPAAFSEEVWFRTTVGAGRLLGFSSARTGTSGSYDRHVYLTATGQLVFGVWQGVYRTVTSPASYTDGQWHHLVATQAPGTDAYPGLRLYVDGALVAADSSVPSGHDTNAVYWRIGGDNLTAWPSAPSSWYVNGSLSWASLYLSALTPDQVAVHHAAGYAPAGISGRHGLLSVAMGWPWHVRHYAFIAYVSAIDSTSDSVSQHDQSFTVETGLAGTGCSSLEASNYPGMFLRQSGYQVFLGTNDGTAAFAQDATFCERASNEGRGVSWESYRYPGRFLRVYTADGGTSVWVARNGGGAVPQDDPANWAAQTSWVLDAPLVP